MEKLRVAVFSFISPWTNEVISIAASCCSIRVSNQVHGVCSSETAEEYQTHQLSPRTKHPKATLLERPRCELQMLVSVCVCVCVCVNGLPRMDSEEGLACQTQRGAPAGACRSLCPSDRCRRRARDSNTPWAFKLGKNGPRNFEKSLKIM